jgi:hypothetical protein
LALGVLAGLTGLAGARQCDEVIDVDVDDLPAKVMKAANKAAPGVAWEEAQKIESEKDDETIVEYFLVGKEKKGKKRIVYFVAREDGARYTVCAQVPLDDVPEEVIDALKDKDANFVPRFALECGTKLGNVQFYRIEGKVGKKGRKVIYFVTPDGKQVLKQ